MAAKGQVLTGSAGTLRIVELEPELLVMEAFDDGTGQLPPAHYHPRPALRTAEFFETLYSGRADENFLSEFSNEIRFG